jgi:hypothetical protein
VSFNPLGPYGAVELLAAQNPRHSHPSWPERVTAISTAAATVATILSAVRDSTPALIISAGILTAVTLIIPGRAAVHRLQHWRQTNAKAQAEAARLERFTSVVNTALKHVTDQLAPWRSNSNTAAHAIEHLVNFLEGKASAELHLRRDVVRAHSMVFKDLPENVTPEQCLLVARIIDEAFHRLVDDLPRYIVECEKSAALLNDWRGGQMLDQTDLLRERVNQLIREYNTFAKEGKETGFSLLNAFDTSKNLRAPARLPPPTAS